MQSVSSRTWTRVAVSISSDNKHYTMGTSNIMNIINDNSFNVHNSLLNYDNKYMKGTLKSKLIGVSREIISADYHEI